MFALTRSAVIICVFSGLVGCSDNNNSKIPVKVPHVTNAERALINLEVGGPPAIVFHVKPIRSTACEYMYVEFGRQSDDGEWDNRTHSISPGQDNRENFGQQNLKNQLHFAEVSQPGEYGVLKLGCKPYGTDRVRDYSRGLQGTFNVEAGKLNYIGELALVPKGYASFETLIENRSDFAIEQIEARLPSLSKFFHQSIVDKTGTKLSPEQEARKAQINANVNRLQTLGEARNKVVKEHDKARAEYKAWKAKHSFVRVNAPDSVKIEHNNILLKADYLAKKVALYDRFVIEKRPEAYTREYIRLYDSLESYYRAYFKEYPLNYPDFSPDKFRGGITQEQASLIDNVMEARLTLEEFEESNP